MTSQCSGERLTPLPPKRTSSVMTLSRIVRIVRTLATSSLLALSKSGHSSKKCRTVSRIPHSHSSFTLACSLDFEKFKLQVPKRKRARIVCCRRVPTKNADAADTQGRSRDKWSKPRFACTIGNQLLCWRAFSAHRTNAFEVESGIRGCAGVGLFEATARAALWAAVLAASFPGTPTWAGTYNIVTEIFACRRCRAE